MDDSGIAASPDAAFMAKGGSSRPKCAYCRAPCAYTDDTPQPTPRPLMKCAGCLTAYYCSKEHQRLDWKRHKVLCKPIQLKLADVAAAEAEAQLTHGDPVGPIPATKAGIGCFSRRRYGSNTQLCLDQRDHYVQHSLTVSAESSCRSSTNNSPPNDQSDYFSNSSSIHGSMADLIAQTAYHTPKGGQYSILQAVGNPKRARFPLTVIRERRSSIGAGEAVRLAQAAAAAAGKAAQPPPPPESFVSSSSSDDDDDLESAYVDRHTTARRKRPASSSIRSSNTSSITNSYNSLGRPEHIHTMADRYPSDQSIQQHACNKKDHRCNAVLNLFTDPRFQLDAMVPRHTAFVLRVRRLALCVASALRDYGWCAVDHFLGETHARAIYHETTSLYMTPGLFADGQLMKAAPPNMASQSSKDVRSDQIYWFDNRVDRGVHISFLVSMVDSIVYHLTEHIPPYRINGRSRAMIACYPGHGTKYVRHVDNPDRDGRCVTTIYYLNENWRNEHGGSLRLYPESSSEPVDIEPLFDRLLFFWSDRRNPHEVLPAYRNRFAITIWYFDAAERAEALAREQREQQEQEAQAMLQAYHQQQAQDNMVLDTGTLSMKLNDAQQARSASCAELNMGPGPAMGPERTTGSDQQVMFGQGNSSSVAYMSSVATASYSQLQQTINRDSPPSGSIPTPKSTADSPLSQCRQEATGQGMQDWSGGAQDHPNFADYSSTLPSDVLKKLISLSARRTSHDQMSNLQNYMNSGGDMRMNLGQASSPEIDPISDN